MKQLLLKIIEKSGGFSAFNRYTRNTAMVFMLHRILPKPEPGEHWLTADMLHEFLNYLYKHKYRVIPLSEYVRALMNKDDTYKTVVFTVDDGYRDFYLHAYEIFRAFNYPAAIFLTGDFIEKRLFLWWDKIEFAINNTARKEIDLGFLGDGLVPISEKAQKDLVISQIVSFCKKINNHEKLQIIDNIIEDLEVDLTEQPGEKYEPLKWEEIEEMSLNGMEFFPHSKTHPILTRLSYDEKKIELGEPKKLIEERLKKSADIFCYPNGQPGDIDQETIDILKSYGHIAAVVGYEGFESTKTEVDLFRIRRFPIPGDTYHFKQFVSGMEFFKRRLKNPD
jgi:peptidoglycan/xylan/chitin deacetylase (PgdA/CDA1 family)